MLALFSFLRQNIKIVGLAALLVALAYFVYEYQDRGTEISRLKMEMILAEKKAKEEILRAKIKTQIEVINEEDKKLKDVNAKFNASHARFLKLRREFLRRKDENSQPNN